MAVMNVSNSIIGKELMEDVWIPFGGVLFAKGHKFSVEDLDFLRAFKIQSVNVFVTEEDEKEIVNKKDEERIEGAEQEVQEDFMTQYKKAAQFMEKVMYDVSAGGPIPLMEIRTWLKRLIDEINKPFGWYMVLKPYQGKNQYTYYHMVSVALISALIARLHKFSPAEIMQIALAGLLSDIGKSKIDPRILQKEGPLTPEEFEEVKRHTIYGYQILKDVKGLKKGVALAALQHHERVNGKGYPFGLTGDKIDTYAKIVAIADVFHAICSIRVYKENESPFRALEQIRYDSVGQFDPALVHIFVNVITQLPLGTVIRLNDGREGKIIYIDRNHPTRPMLDINGHFISLLDHPQLYIQDIVR